MVVASAMVDFFKESGHEVFRGTSGLNRGKTGRCSMFHCNAESPNIDPQFRPIKFENQISIYRG